MKRILALVCACLIGCGEMSYARSPDDDPVPGSQIVELPLSKNQIWSNLHEWVSIAFRNTKGAIDMENEQTGVMIVKGAWPLAMDHLLCTDPSVYGMSFVVKIALKIECKDQKYRYSIADMSLLLISGEKNQDYANMTTGQIKQCIQELETVVRLAEREFNGKDEWRLGENYLTLIRALTNNIEEYRAEIDGGQLTKKQERAALKKIEEAQQELDILKPLLEKSVALGAEIVVSMKERLAQTPGDY